MRIVQGIRETTLERFGCLNQLHPGIAHPFYIDMYWPPTDRQQHMMDSPAFNLPGGDGS